MQLYAIRTELIQPRCDLVAVVLEAIGRQSLKLENGDVRAFASKAVATAEDRLRKLASVKPSLFSLQIRFWFGVR